MLNLHFIYYVVHPIASYSFPMSIKSYTCLYSIDNICNPRFYFHICPSCNHRDIHLLFSHVLINNSDVLSNVAISPYFWNRLLTYFLWIMHKTVFLLSFGSVPYSSFRCPHIRTTIVLQLPVFLLNYRSTYAVLIFFNISIICCIS